MAKKPTTITRKQQKEKNELIEYLKKTPIIQVACQKIGIARATYYRWIKDDKTFRELAEEAIHEGVMLVNDMAESQLLVAIRDKNLTAIFYWLNHRHTAYKSRLELSGEVKAKNDELTPEQEGAIKRALELIANSNTDSINSLPSNNND